MGGLAGHDINYLAMGGALDLNGACGGPPVIPGIQIADLAGGAMQAVTGVLLALAARAQDRARPGGGCLDDGWRRVDAAGRAGHAMRRRARRPRAAMAC